MDPFLRMILVSAAFIALYLFILLVAKVLHDLTTPYHIDEQLAGEGNTALAVSLSGYFLGATVVYIGALFGPSKGFLIDLASVAGYAVLGIFLLNFSRVVNDRLLLYRFRNVKEIIEDRNAGTGAAQAGSYLASGLIIAGSIHGQGGGPLTALAFFVAGQLVLMLFSWVYNLLTPYNIHDEIERDNVAAGVAYGGALAAIGIVLMHASAGSFVSWSFNLTAFAYEAALVVILLPVVRFCFDKILIGRLDLNKSIRAAHLGAGMLEATVMISFSAVLVVLASL